MYVGLPVAPDHVQGSGTTATKLPGQLVHPGLQVCFPVCSSWVLQTGGIKTHSFQTITTLGFDDRKYAVSDQ